MQQQQGRGGGGGGETKVCVSEVEKGDSSSGMAVLMERRLLFGHGIPSASSGRRRWRGTSGCGPLCKEGQVGKFIGDSC